MNVKELRLGNLVGIRGKMEIIKAVWVEHSAVDFGYISTRKGITFGQEQVDPVLITRGLLANFGFQKKDYEIGVMWFIGEDLPPNDYLVLLKWEKNEEFPFYKNKYHIIKYAHQLQNLYLLLTGEELEYEMP